MKQIIIISIFFVFCSISCSQEENKYPSKAEERYYNSRTLKPFEPKNEKYVKSIKHEYIKLNKSPIKTNPFENLWAYTEYGEYLDSLRNICDEKFKDGEDNIESQDIYEQCTDSVMELSYSERIREICKSSILRYDSTNSRKIILYKSFQLEYGYETGYWLSVYDYSSKEWTEYYTGLTANHFYYIKPKPQIEFFKNDSVIQMEIALVRETAQEILPCDPPEFELVEDNLVIEMNLSKVLMDSDKDGLTDIIENKLWTNPNSNDSDSDGIIDYIDNNPRYENLNDKYAKLYLHLFEHSGKDSIVPFEDIEYEKNIEDSLGMKQTLLIITDDENLKHISGTRNRYIFLTNREFEDYKNKNEISIDRLYVSPLFPVDRMPNHYKISIDGFFWGSEFLIIERDDHWIVRNIGGYIV